MLHRCLVLLAVLLLVPPLIPSASPPVPVAEAVTRTGNLWTVTPGASSEIQPAIDAARDNGGGRVRLPAAVYLLTAKVRVHSNVTVYGDGMDRTILRWAPGATIDNMMSNATLSDGNSNLQIWDLTLDGQNLPRPAGQTNCCFGLRLNNVQNSFVVNVAADGHSKDGIYMGYVGTDGAINNRISGCRTSQNARMGIALIHGDGNVIDHCQISNNNRVEVYAGIDLEPDEGMSVTNNKIVANTASAQNVGIQLWVAYNGYATSYHNAVCNNTTASNGTGIHFMRGDQNIFVANQSNGDGLDYNLDDSTLIGPAYASYCTLGALPPHPSTFPSSTATPTLTPTPTPTLTPTPRPSCNPRPQVTVTSKPGPAGTLQVTIGVARQASAPNNTIWRFELGDVQNAIVEIGGQPRPDNASVPLPAGTQQTTFTVRRQTAGQPTTVPFSVVDDCGAWKTFVGGGPSAF